MRTHVTKRFDVRKLKSQPKTPEIQRLSLSLIYKTPFQKLIFLTTTQICDQCFTFNNLLRRQPFYAL